MNALRDLLAGMSEDDLAQLAPQQRNALAHMLQEDQMPQPRYDVAPMQMNSMRTESGPEAGRTVPLDFTAGGSQRPTGAAGGSARPTSRMRLAGMGTDGVLSSLGESDEPTPALDYSRAQLEIAGAGRGFYTKDGRGIYIPDGNGGGTKVLLGYDRNASYLASKREFERRKAEADIEHTDAATQHTRETTNASRAQRSMREDPMSQAVLAKRFGKAEDGKRWTADGRLEIMPGGQKETDANDVLSILKMAEPLLDKATGSYLGMARDEANRVIGRSTDGSEAAAQLKSLEGALIGKMPKMSGPQSDKDVQLYRDMAGQIGDRTVPADQKRAAMETIRELNERYATGGAAAPAVSTGQVPPAEQRQNGRVYATPKGPLRWMGNGWAKP